jgi:hypothetical protein
MTFLEDFWIQDFWYGSDSWILLLGVESDTFKLYLWVIIPPIFKGTAGREKAADWEPGLELH